MSTIIFFTLILFCEGAIFNNDDDYFNKSTKIMEWWQTGVIYQVYPRSFKDSNGDGVGDLRGIEEKAEHFKDLGVVAIWLSPIYKSPMVDFGYDVSDYKDIAEIFGTMEDFRLLKSKLHRLGIKLVLDFVPNHTSDEHEWFQKSVEKIEPYTNYYVWRDPKGWNGSKPMPPNNWISQFSGSAWTYNSRRKQFFYHEFASKQPDLNYRCKELIEEMKNVLIFWMDQGVDGFRFDSVSYLVEKADFPDEPPNLNYVRRPEADKDLLVYDSLNHVYTMDQPETYDLIDFFKEIIDNYTKIDGKSRFMVTEAYTTLNNTLKYYGGSEGPGITMPFNFLFINQLDAQSKAPEFERVIHSWLKNMPKGKWPNWVAGNHDNSRVATRYGRDLVDGINMIILLLPGTAFTYNGEEIGMLDMRVRWDQTVDPQGRNVGPDLYERFSRDPERTPYHWDSTVSAGFSRNHQTWLPVHPNFWYLNLEQEKLLPRSHYHVYKRLVKLRSRPTIQRGSYEVTALSNWTLVITRKIAHFEMYVIIVNLGTEEIVIDLDNLEGIPSDLTVHTSSVNSEHKIGDVIGVFRMRPRSAIVLTNGHDQIPVPEFPESAKVVCPSKGFLAATPHFLTIFILCLIVIDLLK